MWQVTPGSTQVTCIHDKRLKHYADSQLCLPTKRRKPHYRRSIMTGGALCICNSTWPKPLITVWSLWHHICFEPCNIRPEICNQAANTSMQLSFHIKPTHYCMSIKLMCCGGTGTHAEAGRWGPARLTGISWDAICNPQELIEHSWALTRAGRERGRKNLAWEKQESYGTMFSIGAELQA